jgi:nucleoside-diphosphate-sugar epimerase
VFNIGSSTETKIVDLARMIRQLVGSDSQIVEVPYRNVFGENFEETRRRVPDVNRAVELLGFRAETPLQEGLRQTVAWFRQAWPRDRLAPGRNDLAGFFEPSERASSVPRSPD